MKGKTDIHNFEKRLKRRIELITTSKNIVEENKRILIEYYHNCIAEGITLARIDKCLFHLYRIACMLGKPFIECNREDIVRVIENIERKNYSEWTKHDFKKLIEFKKDLGYVHLIEVIIGSGYSLRNNKREFITSLEKPEGEKILVIEFNTDQWKVKGSRTIKFN